MSSALRGTSYIENGTPGPMPGRWTVLGLVVSTFFMGTGLGMYSAWRTLRAEARAHAAVTNALFGHTPRESLHSFRLQSGLLDQQFDNLNYDVLREFGYVNFSAARPLREEEINLLSVHRYKLTRTQSEGSYVEDADGTKECFEEELTCSICLEDAKIGEIIRTLPCYHEFHVACIDPWLRLKGTCPMCKVIAWESS